MGNGWAILFAVGVGVVMAWPIRWLVMSWFPDHDNIPPEPWMEGVNEELEDLADGRVECKHEGRNCEGFVSLYTMSDRRVSLCEYHAWIMRAGKEDEDG